MSMIVSVKAWKWGGDLSHPIGRAKGKAIKCAFHAGIGNAPPPVVKLLTCLNDVVIAISQINFHQQMWPEFRIDIHNMLH